MMFPGNSYKSALFQLKQYTQTNETRVVLALEAEVLSFASCLASGSRTVQKWQTFECTFFRSSDNFYVSYE